MLILAGAAILPLPALAADYDPPVIVDQPVEAVAGLPRLVLDPGQVAAITAGRRLPAGPTALPGHSPGPMALIAGDGQLVALAEADPADGWIQPRKVFINQGLPE